MHMNEKKNIRSEHPCTTNSLLGKERDGGGKQCSEIKQLLLKLNAMKKCWGKWDRAEFGETEE